MWQTKATVKKLYDEELLKQTDPYTYYIGKAKHKSDELSNEGEHANAPFNSSVLPGQGRAVFSFNKITYGTLLIRTDDIKFAFETDIHSVYEYDDLFLFESKKGRSSDEEKIEIFKKSIELNADLTFCDVDHITSSGKRHTPFYKPEFSLDTYKCFDYISDFYVVKKNKSRHAIETLEKIAHVTKVLFHYNCEENEDDIINLHGYDRNIYIDEKIYLSDPELVSAKNKISIVIPSKDNPGLIKKCLEGLIKAEIKSGINRLEVIIVDNGSCEENKTQITDVITKITRDMKSSENLLNINYIYDPCEFNFSKMCNKGAGEAGGEYLVFLNDDIEVTDEIFLLKLLYFARMPHVGAVGCKLLYPGEERRIQHIGITALKLAGPTHKLSTLSDDRVYYFGANRGIHNCLAVTGACMMVSREKYFKTGGFHDKMKVGYNDVDLCVNLYENGYLNVVNNECVLIHHESLTRGADRENIEKLKRLDNERALLYERHPWLLTDGDPYYNGNLAQDFLEYRVNVIPDFERRDYVSDEAAPYVAKKFKKNMTAGKNAFMNIESINENGEYLDISGWALLNKKDNSNCDICIVVTTTKGVSVFKTAKVYRNDLETVFPDAKHVKLSGFLARIPKDIIKGIINVSDREESPAEGVLPDNADAGPGKVSFHLLIVNKRTKKVCYAGKKESDV